MADDDNYNDFISFKWDKAPDDAFAELANVLVEKIQSVIYQIVKSWSPTVEQWMQNNAPWRDITGEARSGLSAKARLVFNKFVIMRMSYSVYYGTYLEGYNPKTNSPMSNQGMWDIITPAIDYFGPLIWVDIKHQLEGGDSSIKDSLMEDDSGREGGSPYDMELGDDNYDGDSSDYGEDYGDDFFGSDY